VRLRSVCAAAHANAAEGSLNIKVPLAMAFGKRSAPPLRYAVSTSR
jgi:hypothetical protein